MAEIEFIPEPRPDHLGRETMPRLILLGWFFLSISPVHARELPPVDEIDWPTFRAEVRGLLKRLDQLERGGVAVLPADVLRQTRRLTSSEEQPDDPRQRVREVQKILDSHCLLGVSINPESRVKAARGELRLPLRQGETRYALVRVHNEGGVTHALRVGSEQAYEPGSRDADRWLELSLVNEAPFDNRLSGRLVEYRLIKLRPQQSGKREAVLSFDVGQGSQDLGFRSDLPILFAIQPR